MSKHSNPLDGVRVAKPCTADWASMAGDERARFCNLCDLHVYNLSGMSRRDAEALITNTEGRLCVRFYRREDGTILTRDCPVGLRALKRRVSRIANAVMSAALGFFGGLGLNYALSPTEYIMGGIAMPPDSGSTLGTMISTRPEPVSVVEQFAVMGDLEVEVGRAPVKKKEARRLRK
ncbi:MAG: hypothetical protein H0T60_09160 [Acidobacteria bacterium]|nr:hypothetical protein [Acidobacteriota bacterium]